MKNKQFVPVKEYAPNVPPDDGTDGADAYNLNTTPEVSTFVIGSVPVYPFDVWNSI